MKGILFTVEVGSGKNCCDNRNYFDFIRIFIVYVKYRKCTCEPHSIGDDDVKHICSRNHFAILEEKPDELLLIIQIMRVDLWFRTQSLSK